MKSTDSESVCNVMKENSSKIIQKLESKIPIFVQKNSDFYTENLHMLDDVFNTCYLSEKRFLDSMNIDENYLKSFNDFSNHMTDLIINQIDMNTKLFETYKQIQINYIRLFDESFHNMINMFENISMTGSSTK